MQPPKVSRLAALTWTTGALFWEGMSVLCSVRERWWIAFLAHLLCAVSLGFAAARGEREGRWRSAASVAAWTLCVPVFAALGISSVLLPAFGRLREEEQDGIVEIALARPQPVPPRAAQDAPLRDLLVKMADDPKQRVAALMSLRHAELTRAAPLLRLALLDANEDIRLLAYALLERREQPLRARIEANRAQLTDDTPHALVLLEQLCNDHWLLAEAGFVSGESAHQTLMAALDFGERALWLENDAALRVLLGKICLRAHKPERAQVHLSHADRLGTARSVLAPLFAQVAFQQGRFAEIGPLLSVSSSARLARPEESGARALWSGTELV